MTPPSNRTADNGRLTIRIDEATKADMIQFGNEHNLSLAWIVKRAWEQFKKSVKNGEIKL